MLEAIAKRRSVRTYRREAPTAGQLHEIVKAAGMAPSGMDSQSWQFILLTGEALEYIRLVVRDHFRTMQLTENHPPFFFKCREWAKDDGWSFFYGAPALLVVANRYGYANAAADCAAATENAAIEATALGLASCWITTLSGTCLDAPIHAALTRLGLKPGYRVYTSLAIGYADGIPEASPRKYEFTEVTTVGD